MQVYLPIAEMSVNVFLVLGLGGAVGLLSGLFGVGGGFLMTPLLIFIGVPPAVAVGTQSVQIVASSVSGVLAHMRRGTVDFAMGLILTVGGDKKFVLHPESEDVFFTADRDLTFQFVKAGTKVSKIVIRERGAVVEEVRPE